MLFPSSDTTDHLQDGRCTWQKNSAQPRELCCVSPKGLASSELILTAIFCCPPGEGRNMDGWALSDLYRFTSSSGAELLLLDLFCPASVPLGNGVSNRTA